MSSESVHIVTGSRLHFGLLGVNSSDRNLRAFGGVGLMIESPGICLSARIGESWSAVGPHADRAMVFARRFAETVPGPRPCSIVIESAAREHVGLGTGTQLGLAVAKALTTLYKMPVVPAAGLAERVGRGARSGLGVHGFEHGGFLVDGGKGPGTNIAPLLARYAFPDEWRVLVVIPEGSGLSGDAERKAFDHLDREGLHSDILCRLTLLGMLPALVERDIQAFGEALYEFNGRVGELFRTPQGGVYGSKVVADLVSFLRAEGVHGVGQSSWGPAVFAVVEAERATELRRTIGETFHLSAEDVIVTSTTNRGADVRLQGD